MILYPTSYDYLIIDEFRFNVGDLVSTVLGEYGIVLGYGKHKVHPSDHSEYYYVLIKDSIHYYLPCALIKIQK